MLKPLFERMRTDGPEFLQKSSALAEEIRRTFVDIDEIDNQLKRAERAVESASGMVSKHKLRLVGLCDGAVGHGMAAPVVQQSQ